MDWLDPENLLGIITGVVTVASGLANLTRGDADNRAVRRIARLINLLAINWRRR